MQKEIIIRKRFCGPKTSGNGGYSSGLIAKHLPFSSEVRLLAPPPLDTPMQLVVGDSEAVLTLNGASIASAQHKELELDVPTPPSIQEAKSAEQHYRGVSHHSLSDCFVCGPSRETGDGLRIFAGKTDHDDLFASSWRVDESLDSTEGKLNSEFIWAALDCPGYFAVQDTADFALLGSFSVKIVKAVDVGDTLIVTGWPIASEGRKHIAGTALFDQNQQLVAKALATWISVPRDIFMKSTQ